MDVVAQAPKPLFGLDPRTKFMVLFTIGIFAFSGIGLAIELSIFAILNLFLLSYRQRSFVIKFGIVYLILLAADITFTPYIAGWIAPLFFSIARFARLVMLILLAANLLIKTTSISEFNAAFRKLHIPEQIVIPFSVMFRFIPTIQEEWHSIQNAMKLRGIATSIGVVIKAPMQTLEYGLIPILMSVSTISGELAAASLSRGLEAGGDRTCLAEVKFGVVDYLVFALCIALIVRQVVF